MLYNSNKYTSVNEVPEDIDLAIVVVNSKFVLSTIDQCNEKGIKGLCIITAGFKESGKEGAELEKQLSEFRWWNGNAK